MATAAAADYVQAWQCIGCGRIEAPQTCIGVCRDKKIFVIGKDQHERALAEIGLLQDKLGEVRRQLLRFAHCTPGEGRSEDAFLALREQARRLVAQLADA